MVLEVNSNVTRVSVYTSHATGTLLATFKILNSRREDLKRT